MARRDKRLDAEKSPALRGEALKVYHLVAALVDQGYAENMTKAYEICKHVGAHSGWSLQWEEALHLGHRAGGIRVIAHPGRAEPGFTTASAPLLDRMRAIGLDGFFFQAEDGIRDLYVTGVQTCALPIFLPGAGAAAADRSADLPARKRGGGHGTRALILPSRLPFSMARSSPSGAAAHEDRR